MSLLRPAFTAAIFTAAFLLFWVQPLFGKMMLPTFGGSPSVWLTAMVFYQGVLLLGYTYAHLLGKLPQRGYQIVVHLALMLAAVTFLPPALPAGWQPPLDGHSPAFSILSVMAMTIGLPLFVLSASSPLLQKWFSESTDADPYPLYAASNAGSMASLLMFPFVIEVFFPVQQQADGWMVGFLLLIGLFVACMGFFRKGRPAAAVVGDAGPDAPVTWQQRGLWILYAFVPSSLLLGLTQYITIDIASIALLWIVPLALYLLTFIGAFREKPWFSLKTTVLVQLALTAPLVTILAGWGTVPSKYILLLHLGWFFFTALMCHQTLFANRPKPRHLTEFYLLLPFGGFLGGVFNALLAPVLFPDIWEYLVVIAVVAWLRPAGLVFGDQKHALRRFAGIIMLVSVVVVLALVSGLNPARFSNLVQQPIFPIQMGFLVFMSAVLAYSLKKPGYAGLAVTAFIVLTLSNRQTPDIIYQDRSFFGAYKVREMKNAADKSVTHDFVHGTTLHGVQRRDADRDVPRSYYHPNGPFGDVFKARHDDKRAPMERVAVTGLGAGGMLCWRQPGETWTFYEIDPLVEEIARDPDLFSFIGDCGPETKVVIGDARLTMQNSPAKGYDAIFLDAFSSDAVPMHLLTVEALDVYLSRLKDDGFIVYHISNRHLDLEPVIAGLAKARGLKAYASIRDGFDSMETSKDPTFVPSSLVVVGHVIPKAIVESERWEDLSGSREILWTDSHSNILPVLKWFK